MSVLTILIRSLLVFLVLGLLFVPARMITAPAYEAEAFEQKVILTEKIDSSALPMDKTKILQEPAYSYLQIEGTGFVPASYDRPKNDTANRLAVAKDLAEQKQFENALIILGNVKTVDASSYDVRFLKARIMSWAGKHNEADLIFRGLRSEFPEDADILVAYAYLKYYKGHFNEAEAMFTKVLAKYPEYSDASMGIERVRKARQGY